MIRSYSLRVAILLLVATSLLSSCKDDSEKNEPLRVAVAANVQFAMKEIETAFEKAHDIDIEYSLGSSGKLTAQIQNGAPFHVFLAANMKYPQALTESGHATGDVQVYAMGDVVAWTNQKKIDPANWENLITTDQIERIALPNPRNAPYGEAAVACLQKRGLYSTVEPKIVMGENISQANQFIVSRSADIGFTSKSVVLSPKMKKTGRWSDLPDGCYDPIKQGVVITRKGSNEKAEQSSTFREFLFSKKAAEIFQRYGYRTQQ